VWAVGRLATCLSVHSHARWATLEKEFPLRRAFLSISIAMLFVSSLAAADADTLPRKAPELAFTVPGQGQKLLSQYRGKVVALELVFTTCPHCQHASQVMTKLQAEYGPKGFQALDVAFNDNADLLVDNFVKDFQVGFPVGWTVREQVLNFMNLSIMDRFVVPQLALIDRKGIIHYMTPPLGDDTSMNEATIRQRIQELLALGSGTGTTVRKSASAAHPPAPKS
jgi:thiol-disulfide isomerase/thioredoxin